MTKNSNKRTKPYYLLKEMSYMENFVRTPEAKMGISYKVEEGVGDDSSQIVYTIHKGDDAMNTSTEYTTEIVNIKDGISGEADLEEEEELEEIEHVPSSSILELDTDHQEEANHNEQANTSHTDQLLHDLAHPDLAFFRSIIPDMEAMNPAQKAKFKAAVMNSLNSILYS